MQRGNSGSKKSKIIPFSMREEEVYISKKLGLDSL
jgi:hypothetical protein